MFDVHLVLLLIGFLLLVCVLLSKFTAKIGVPALLIFLIVGLILDTNQVISSTITNYSYVQSISIFALIIIMFSGGLDTELANIKRVTWEGVSLSTIGVLITAVVVGVLVHVLFGLGWLDSFLIGSIISSTDAAAVFSIFKTQKLKIKDNLDHMLELESATNDPMAYILVTSILYLMVHPESSILMLVFNFFKSLALGAIFGLVLGRGFSKLLARIKLRVEGLYPVLLLAAAILSFAVAEVAGGNGFLSVYLAAVIIGNCKIKYKYTQLAFFEGIAWIMQIVMFVLLGAFSSIKDLIPMLIPAIWIAMILTFVARPIAVLISLAPFDIDRPSKAFISWAGIKGAVPIVFAFYPLVYGIFNAHIIFDIVMVVTCISVLVQGSTLKFMAKHLKVLEEE
jgi:potassium/hydrogen antiporter